MSAVLVADMVAYSRLMELDEIDTLERQKFYRTHVFDPELADHNGRVVKTTGDGLLAEFPSVIEAVSCSVDIQREMEKREASSSAERRIEYRFGINLGDVIFDEGDIFGDGVNIAARLEQLADPGGICISGSAYEHLRNLVEAGYQDLGEVQVKNISRPVRAWRVLLDPDQAGRVVTTPSGTPAQGSQSALEELETKHGSLANALDELNEANRDQMEAIANRFEIANAFDMTDRKLRSEIFRKADDFRRYRAQIERIDTRTVNLSKAKAAASEAADRLDFDEVEALLSQVMETEIGLAAETAELRAQNALLRGDVDLAFVLLSSTADSFAAIDPLEPVRRRFEYEAALCDHGQRYGNQGLVYGEKMMRSVISTLDGSDPMLLWRATIGLGIALSSQGKFAPGDEGVRLLEEAASLYNHALTILTEESSPVQIATTRNNLGTVLGILARRPGQTDVKELSQAAVGHYQEALKVHTRSDFPLKWAMAQDNLGNALSELGAVVPGAEGGRLLAQACTAHSAALTVRTQDDHLIEWAQTQENIGITWTAIAAHDSCRDPDAARRTAEDHLNKALDVFDPDEFPIFHAKAQANVGLLLEGELNSPACTDRADTRGAALTRFENAQQIFDEFGPPHFAALTHDAIARLNEMPD